MDTFTALGEDMAQGAAPHADAFTEEEYAVLCTVAGAMRMTVDEFLAEELSKSSPEEARGYLKAFVVHGTDAQIRTMYFLTRALAGKS